MYTEHAHTHTYVHIHISILRMGSDAGTNRASYRVPSGYNAHLT